jgi:hypothetical protein
MLCYEKRLVGAVLFGVGGLNYRWLKMSSFGHGYEMEGSFRKLLLYLV